MESSENIRRDIDLAKTENRLRGSAPPDSSSEEKQQIREVWCCELFRFATCFDIVLMVIGSIGAIGMGAALPAFAFIWGQMIDSFTNFEAQPDAAVDDAKQAMLMFIYVGIGAMGAGWLMFACWMVAGERQAISCRKAYLRSLLRQQIGWFDLINQTQLSSKFATDTFAFQNAIGEKISMLIMTAAMFVSGFIFAFISGWLMALVVLAAIPGLAIASMGYIAVVANKDKKQSEDYAKAGGRAEQAISAIKTVKQLNGQQHETSEYERCLNKVAESTCKFAALAGLAIGFTMFMMLSTYALGFWYGSRCVIGIENCPYSVSQQVYTVGDVLVVFFSLVMASFNVGQISPALKKISEGRQAASRIFDVIDREPLIRNSPNSIVPTKFEGVIQFENVTFAYPKQKSTPILKNLSISFNLKHSAIVGESGCGKSTILQLIMRFYDPDQGRILLDGHDLRDIDLIWLRQQIGYVGQEPVLFATTILENLSFGREEATIDEINKALKQAEAYDFVQELEQKLNTYVGYGGGQLSGGQKQRIAIARALLRNPKILLLDEATSALDRRNEKLIQNTLDDVTAERTTITVAHRVKTIMKAEMIFVLERGELLEKGSFSSLGRYKDYKAVEQAKEEIIDKKDDKQLEGEKQMKQNNVEIVQEKNEEEKKEEEKKYQEELLQKYNEQIFTRLFSYASDKCGLFILGIFLAIANGVVFPLFSIFLARMMVSLTYLSILQNPEGSEYDDEAKFSALLFFILGIASLIVTTFQLLIFGVIGESITRKLRIETYNKILRMPIPWFDLPRNNGGSLTARLSTDCQSVNGIVTTTISVVVQNLSTLISGLIIAFFYEWRTSLVALGLIPFMMLSGAVQMNLNTGFSDKTDKAYKDSSNLIMESMINIRTVNSFGYEGIIAKKYDQRMEEPYQLAIKKGNASGFLYGLSQLLTFSIFGIIFYLGALFARDNDDVNVMDMFTSVLAILFAGMTAGNNSHFIPDLAACKNSAANLFTILDGKDENQIQDESGSKMLTSGIVGDIELKDVSFKYESRNDYVFENMNVKIKYGTKAAFVGASGCGKSTIMQLLLRYYEVNSGEILINGRNIKDFELHYLRSNFGVVSQEPVLFNASFKENIKYNLYAAKEEDIVEASRKANALSFIMGKEKMGGMIEENEKQVAEAGFDRSVGVKGSHISGGQKQRVAIARAILRNPEKLLLDEATSALDQENEKKVQASLDEMMVGKTTINIAHRIETIKDSDKIFVFQKGRIVESGTYKELVGLKGYFYNLERGTQFV